MATSTIYLCKNVPLTNRYEHTLYFASAAAQSSYFQGKVASTLHDVTYLRKSWTIKAPIDMDAARHYSYLFFKNGDTGKTWYYFVTDVQYINDRTTELTIELDVLQTYMFDWSLHSCFIEREHTTSDNPGEHLTDEGLDTGDLTTASCGYYHMYDCCILIMSTVALGVSGNPKVYSSKYNGVFGGAAIYAVNIRDWAALGEGLNLLSGDGKIDAIISIWMYPRSLVTLSSGSSWADDYVFKEVDNCKMESISIGGRLDNLNGYTPKNKKLLQYPYTFLYVTNNGGGAATYKYEHFGDPSSPHFNVFGTLSPEGVAYTYPLNYKGMQHNYEEGLQFSGFPTCSWNADTYKLWLAQNQNQQQLAYTTTGLQIAGGVATAIAGIATGNILAAGGGAGAALHGVNAIQSIMAQRADMEIQPPQARGNHSGSLALTAQQNHFEFQRKCIDSEHAKQIDDFFTMYGYAVRRAKIPSIHNRPAFTYVKTRGSNATGNIPGADLAKINQIFDTGVTFWSDHENVGNYSVNNSV